MSTYHFFKNEFCHINCLCLFQWLSLWPFCQVVHCYDQISISFCCHWQWSFNVDPNLIKRSFYRYRMCLLPPIWFSSLLACITLLDVSLYTIVHLGPIVPFLKLFICCLYP